MYAWTGPDDSNTSRRACATQFSWRSFCQHHLANRSSPEASEQSRVSPTSLMAQDMAEKIGGLQLGCGIWICVGLSEKSISCVALSSHNFFAGTDIQNMPSAAKRFRMTRSCPIII